MKNILVVSFFILFGISQSSEAQVTLNPGIRAGVNFSKFTNYNADFKTGFYVGGVFVIKFNKIYTLQPELVYSRQGGSITFKFNTLQGFEQYDPNFLTEKDISFTIDYLSLSAISKFNINGGFHLLVGPSLDFKVNDTSILNEPVGFDFALVGGMGYSLPNGLSFEARFKQGMVDVYGYNYKTNIEVILNQSFQLGATYTFDIK